MSYRYVKYYFELNSNHNSLTILYSPKNIKNPRNTNIIYIQCIEDCKEEKDSSLEK